MPAATPSPSHLRSARLRSAAALRAVRTHPGVTRAWRARRTRVLLTFLGWLALACLQSPGLTVADTKHDLTAHPLGFLLQALRPWSDVFPLGQLQNQAYGYLFPHGTFFAALAWLPDWLTQRLWWALLLTLASVGTVRLLEAARVGSPASRMAAALLFALSPRILSTLGAISSEAWVVALSPWVLLPVVRAMAAAPGSPQAAQPPGDHGHPTRVSPTHEGPAHRRYLRNQALTSAVAIACLGAVNAVATAVATLPAALWWLCSLARTRRAGDTPGQARAQRQAARYFALWWIPSGLAACFWWIGPLLLLGRYSPPFTDYIESAALTTRWLNLLEVLRGTTSWVPFLSTERVAGHALVVGDVFILATLAVALLGLYGLSRRSCPHALRWLLILGVGVAAMLSATGPLNPFENQVQAFLDGPGAALRNLHKFDLLVRLALVAGFAHATRGVQPAFEAPPGGSWTQLASRWAHPERHPAVVRAIALILVLVAATAPALSGRLAPADGYRAVPAYWQQAADYLNATATPDSGRTLVLPKARFARQTWGNTRDEPLQPLLDVPWVVRDSVPLVPPEAIRALDGVQRELESGAAIPSLAASLRQQGVGRVLLRWDLTRAADTTGAQQVLRTLERSGGFVEVAAFPQPATRGTGSEAGSDARANDGAAPTQGAPQVRVFDVQPGVSAGGTAQAGAAHASAPAGASQSTAQPGTQADAAQSGAQPANSQPATQPAAAQPGALRIVPLDAVEVIQAGPEALPRLAEADRALGRTAPPRTRILASDIPPQLHLPDTRPQTVTDTPALREHNYGNVVDADSEIRAPQDHHSVLNPVIDYPVRGLDGQPLPPQQLTHVQETGGRVTASSSASDPTAFGGADTTSSLTAAVDRNPETAWRPAPGIVVGEYLQLQVDNPTDDLQVSFTTQGTGARIHVTTLLIDTDPATGNPIRERKVGSTTLTAQGGQVTAVPIPPGRANAVRLEILGAFGDVGISEVTMRDGSTGKDITPRRVVTVPSPGDGAGGAVNRWVFGQEIPEGTLVRRFTVPSGAPLPVVVHAPSCAAPAAPAAATQASPAQGPRAQAPAPRTTAAQAPAARTTAAQATPAQAPASRAASSRAAAIAIDGTPVNCGTTVQLSPGEHTVSTEQRWVAITVAEPLFAAAVAQAPAAIHTGEAEEAGTPGTSLADLSPRAHVGASGQDRIIFGATSVNEGRIAEFTPDTPGAAPVRLDPVRINGWQQGWILPAGGAGTVQVRFAPTAFYQVWLGVGAVLLLGLGAAFAAVRWGDARRARAARGTTAADGGAAGDPARPEAATATGTDMDLAADADVQADATALNSPTAPGTEPANAAADADRTSRIAAGTILTTGAVTAAVATRQTWGSAAYAGDHWWVQLLLLLALLAAYAPHVRFTHRRDGSSTSE